MSAALVRRIGRGLLVTALTLPLLLSGFGGIAGTGGQEAVAAPAISAAQASAAAVAPPQAGEEVVERRTRFSRTTVEADGTYTAAISAEPVHYRDAAGNWQPIDSALVAKPGEAFGHRANGFDLSLPRSLTSPVRIGRGSVWASLQLQGAAGQAAVAGATASYTDALAAVDVRYTATAEGLKEALVLKSRAAPSGFVFTLRSSAGLSPRLAGRAVELVDSSGRIVFRLAAPFMVDGANSVSRALSVSLAPVAGAHVLTVTADQGWLASPERRYPVVIDPTMTFFTTGYLEGYWADCTLNSQMPQTSTCDLDNLEAGHEAGARKRTVMQWEVECCEPGRDGPVPIEIMSAELRLYAEQVTGSGTLSAHRLSRSYANGVNWATYDGTNAWTAAGGDFSSTAETLTETAGGGRWYSWFVTSLVKGWAEGTIPNQGMLVKSTTEATGFSARFRSTDYAGTDFDPVLRVNYRQHLGMQRQFQFESEKVSDRLTLNVNVGNGNLVLQRDELNLNGTGIDLRISHYFNGLRPFTRYSGHGWSLGTGHDIFLKHQPAQDMMLSGPSFYGVLFRSGAPNNTYYSPTGIDATLKKISTFFTTRYELKFHGSNEVWHFNADGVLTKQVDRNGNTLTFTYTGKKVSTITDSQNRVVTFVYDGNGRLQSITDPSLRQWQYGYTSDGYLTSSTDPANNQTLYSYDAAGRLTQITDALGNQTRIAYDLDRRVTSVTRVTDNGAGTGPTTTFEYPSVSSTVVRDPRGNPTTYTLDNELRVTEVRDVNGNTSTAGFTANSDVSSYSPTSGTTWSYQYDPNNTLTQEEAPTGGKLTYEYNSGHPHLPSKATDQQGNATTYEYDSKGNLTAVVNAAATQNRSTYTYNANGTLATATDFKGNVTSYGYDVKGNLTSVDRPAPLGDVTMAYDSLSRLTSVTDGKNQQTSYTYDILDRTTRIDYQDGSSIAYSYDANGNLLTTTDNTGTSTYTYDRLNRIVTESLPGRPQISYIYDLASNLISYTDAGGTVGYAYNNLNLLSTLTEPGGQQTTFVYDAIHRRTQTNYANGVSMFFTHDQSNRQTRVLGQKPASGQVLTDFSYSWQLNGQDTGLRRTVTDKDGNVTTYSYDVLNRLTQAVAPQRNYSYGYDANSNRTTQNINGVTTNYTHNAADQLTSAGSTTFSYDGNGNETSTSAGRQWAYNAQDQATSVTPPGGSPLPMTYTGLGQFKRVSAGTTQFTTSGLGLTREDSTSYVRDDNGKLLAMRTGSGSHYYLLDGLGSVVALTDSSGNLAATYNYEPFGKLVSSTGTIANPYRWLGGFGAGAYYDLVTGLYKMGARYYDPGLGRFTQVDPIAGGSANAYDYAAQDPCNRVDVRGTDWEGFATCMSYHIGVACAKVLFRCRKFVGLPFVGSALFAACVLKRCGRAAYHSYNKCKKHL